MNLPDGLRLDFIDKLCAIMAKHGVTSLKEGELTINLPPRAVAAETARPKTFDEEIEARMKADANKVEAELMNQKLRARQA